MKFEIGQKVLCRVDSTGVIIPSAWTEGPTKDFLIIGHCSQNINQYILLVNKNNGREICDYHLRIDKVDPKYKGMYELHISNYAIKLLKNICHDCKKHG